MHAGTKVFLESGQANLLRLRAAANSRPPFQNEHSEAGLRKIRGADQAVVPGSRHYEVEAIARRWLLRQAKRSEGQRRERRGALYESTSSDFAHVLPLF